MDSFNKNANPGSHILLGIHEKHLVDRQCFKDIIWNFQFRYREIVNKLIGIVE